MAGFESLNARIAPGDPALRPGDYTVRDGAPVDRSQALDRCPYCADPMLEFVTPGAMRVATAKAPPRHGVQVVGVDPLPRGTRLLKCQACDQFFSTLGVR